MSTHDEQPTTYPRGHLLNLPLELRQQVYHELISSPKIWVRRYAKPRPDTHQSWSTEDHSFTRFSMSLRTILVRRFAPDTSPAVKDCRCSFKEFPHSLITTCRQLRYELTDVLLLETQLVVEKCVQLEKAYFRPRLQAQGPATPLLREVRHIVLHPGARLEAPNLFPFLESVTIVGGVVRFHTPNDAYIALSSDQRRDQIEKDLMAGTHDVQLLKEARTDILRWNHWMKQNSQETYSQYYPRGGRARLSACCLIQVGIPSHAMMICFEWLSNQITYRWFGKVPPEIDWEALSKRGNMFFRGNPNTSLHNVSTSASV